MPKKPTRLTDVAVDTVGLVDAGQVGEDFYLIKRSSKGGKMGKDVVVEETPDVEETPTGEGDQVPESLIQKLQGIFVSKAELDNTEPESEDELPNETTDEVTAEVDEEPSNDDEVPASVSKAISKLEKAYAAQVSALQKTLDATQKRLDEAEDVAKATQEAAAKREMIEKAASMRALPMSRVQLGTLMYKMHKALPKDVFDEVEGLLKAADQQAFAAGLFNEMGTVATPEELDLTQKVAKAVQDEGISPKDALLKLSPEEQEELLEGVKYIEGGRS